MDNSPYFKGSLLPNANSGQSLSLPSFQLFIGLLVSDVKTLKSKQILIPILEVHHSQGQPTLILL